MKFIDNWRNAYQFLSVQFAALIVIANILYENLALLKEALPASSLSWLNGVLAVLVVLGRIKAQAGIPNSPHE